MRLDYRRERLLIEGRKALQALKAGRSMPDLILATPGSRARLYRAIAAARAEQTPARDPLLE